MTADETEIHDFLRNFPHLYVSVLEISKRLGSRGRYKQDRAWARPVLRRMEMDGIVESNPFGEYRLANRGNDQTLFKDALRQPTNIPLGDTTIILKDEAE